MIAIDNIGTFESEHEAVLQGLSQWLPYPDTTQVPGGRVFYHADAFAPTVDEWNKVPVYFVPPGLLVRHPPHDQVRRDPEEIARFLGYRLAGKLNNTKVTGSQMVADVVLNDAHASELARAGRLGLSTGFDAVLSPEGKIRSPVSPNHILVFVKCQKAAAGEHCGTGNDPAAAFNNLGEPRKAINNTRSPGSSKDLSIMEAEQQAARDVRNGRPLEHAMYLSKDQALARYAAAVEMIKARGKLDPATGTFRDFRSCEGPE